jgi:hypothetical protein
MFRMHSLIFVLCTSLAVIACGDDEEDGDNNNGTGGQSGEGTGGKSGETELTTITGTINYEGEAEGPLVISIHSSFPPSMANVMGAAQVAEPQFPQEYTVESVPPGEYFVLAYIAVGMFHLGAGPGDPTGAYVIDGMPAPIEVTDEPVEGIDFDLSDEPPPAP